MEKNIVQQAGHNIGKEIIKYSSGYTCLRVIKHRQNKEKKIRNHLDALIILLHIIHPDKRVISEYTFTHLFILNEWQSCTSLILCCIFLFSLHTTCKHRGCRTLCYSRIFRSEELLISNQVTNLVTKRMSQNHQSKTCIVANMNARMLI